MNETEPFCGTELLAFSEFYQQYVHGYASLFMCVVGSFANIMNIVVFTRKNMISPINIVLTGLAIADLAVLLDYIPFTFHMFLRPKSHSVKDRYTYGWALFILWHSNFSQVFHTVSIWLTVVLAVWRYIAVVYPLNIREWCNMKNTYRAVVGGYIICPVIWIPHFLSLTITPQVVLLDEDGFQTKNDLTGSYTTVYVVAMTNIDVNRSAVQNLNFAVYTVVKLIPSIVLLGLSFRLVGALLETKNRRQKLMSSQNRKNAKNVEKEKQTDRTTRMLLAVLFLFLAAEVPQGILGTLTLFFGEKFFQDCYQKLGDLIDMLALTTSTFNIVFFYVISSQFRTTFQSLFSYNTSLHREHFSLNKKNSFTTTIT